LLRLLGGVAKWVYLIATADSASDSARDSSENISKIVLLSWLILICAGLWLWLTGSEVEIEEIGYSILLLFLVLRWLLTAEIEVEFVLTGLVFSRFIVAVPEIKVVKVIPSYCISATLVVGRKLLETRSEVEILVWFCMASDLAGALLHLPGFQRFFFEALFLLFLSCDF
jgi:hypothetical protein